MHHLLQENSRHHLKDINLKFAFPSFLHQNSTAIPAIPPSKHDYTAQIAANLLSTAHSSTRT
jgi:hypothetical protein